MWAKRRGGERNIMRFIVEESHFFLYEGSDIKKSPSTVQFPSENGQKKCTLDFFLLSFFPFSAKKRLFSAPKGVARAMPKPLVRAKKRESFGFGFLQTNQLDSTDS